MNELTGWWDGMSRTYTVYDPQLRMVIVYAFNATRTYDALGPVWNGHHSKEEE